MINYTSVHAAGPNQPAIKLRSDDFMEPRLWSVYWAHYEHAGGVMRPILSSDLRRLSASSQGVRKTIKQHVIEFQSSFIVLNTLSTAATARFFRFLRLNGIYGISEKFLSGAGTLTEADLHDSQRVFY